MSHFQIDVAGGKTVRLPTAGKVCNGDIYITGKGGDTSDAYEEGKAAGMEQGYNAGNQWWLDMVASKTECYGMFSYANIETFTDLVIPMTSAITASGAFSYMPNLKAPVSFSAPVCTNFSTIFRNTTVPEVTFIGGGKETNWYYAFYLSNIQKITMRNLGKISDAQMMFADNRTLVEIDADLDFTDNANINRMFYVTAALQKVRFVPGAIKKSIGFEYCSSLTLDSLQSIVDGLADLTGATAQTLTLTKASGSKLTDVQKAAISAKNWTLAY